MKQLGFDDEVDSNGIAYGAKIIGSGGGGCIVALCPIHLQDKISIAIKKAGAKDAYPVCVAKGTEMIIDG